MPGGHIIKPYTLMDYMGGILILDLKTSKNDTLSLRHNGGCLKRGSLLFIKNAYCLWRMTANKQTMPLWQLHSKLIFIK
jgi:hypothetical protein